MEEAGDTGSPEEDVLLKLTMPGKSLRPQTIVKAKKAESSGVVNQGWYREKVSEPVQNAREEQLNQEVEVQQAEFSSEVHPQAEIQGKRVEPEKNAEEDVLLKLTVPGKQLRETSVTQKNEERASDVHEEVEQNVLSVQPEKEDLPEPPKDHPHLADHYGMSDIKKLAEHLFNSDVVVNRAKKQ